MSDDINTTPTVRIGVLGSSVVDIPFEEGMTIAQALEQADVDLGESGYSLRVNNQPTTPDTVLNENDLILLVGQISGG